MPDARAGGSDHRLGARYQGRCACRALAATLRHEWAGALERYPATISRSSWEGSQRSGWAQTGASRDALTQFEVEQRHNP